MVAGVPEPGKRVRKLSRHWLDKVHEQMNDAERFVQTTDDDSFSLPEGVIPIRNRTGAAVSRFGVVGIDVPVIAASDNAEEFIGIAGFDGVDPVLADHALLFAIALEPIAYNADESLTGWGLCQVTGLVVTKIDVRSEDHTHVALRHDAGSVKLWTEFGGPGRIISSESGTGEKHAYIDLQPSSGPWFARGYTAEPMATATVNGSKIEPSETLCRIWQRDSNGDLAVDTGEDIILQNFDDSASAVEDAYGKFAFDGWQWSHVWLACTASQHPDPSP